MVGRVKLDRKMYKWKIARILCGLSPQSPTQNVNAKFEVVIFMVMLFI